MPDASRFHGHIGPANLIAAVRTTAPFLFTGSVADDRPPVRLADLAAPVSGWHAIIRHGHRLPAVARPTPDQRVDYFALCLACHHATVATYVPTDVDSKIRGHAWHDPDGGVRRAQFAVVERALGWDVDAVSRRAVRVPGVDGGRPISGHDGEWLGVLCGAWGAFLRGGDNDHAARAEALIAAELQREADAFATLIAAPGREIEALKLAAILTHNAGDIDQGLGQWKPGGFAEPRARHARLAHEHPERFAGAFAIAARLYRALLAAEGHRHYPLREARALRRFPDLLFPISPFLEPWGEAVGKHGGLDLDERAEVAAALLNGCRKVPNQIGYHRALHGMARSCRLDDLAKRMPGPAAAMLDDETVRRHLEWSERDFADDLAQRMRQRLVG